MGLKSITSKKLFLLLFIPLLFSFPFVSASSGLESGAVKLNLFIVIGVICLLLFVAGFAFEQSFLIIVATVFMFMCGFIINAGNLYLPTGNINESLSYNYNESLNISQHSDTYIEKEYEAWDGNNNHLVGWTIMFLSVILFALALMNSGGGDDY